MKLQLILAVIALILLTSIGFSQSSVVDNNMKITTFSDPLFSFETDSFTWLGIGHVYVSVENQKGVKQKINISTLFPVSVKIEGIYLWEEYTWDVNDQQVSCSPYTIQENGTDTPVENCTTTNNWVQQSTWRWEDAKSFLLKTNKKEHKSDAINVGKGETKYFRFDVVLPFASTGKFDIKTYNEDKTISTLDPIWSSNFTYKRNYTLQDISGTLPNFPHLLNSSLNSCLFRLTDLVNDGKLQSGANDLRVIDNTETSELSFEIASDTCVWAKDTVTSGQINKIYYGDPIATSGENSEDVWSNGYASVFHFDEHGDTASPTPFNDSTSNNLVMDTSGTVSTTQGQFGFFLDLTTGGHIAKVNDSPAVNFNQDYTIEIWANLSSTTPSGTTEVVIKGGDGVNPQQQIRWTKSATNIGCGIYDGSNFDLANWNYAVGSAIENDWHYYACVLNQSGTGSITFYFDGEQKAQVAPLTVSGDLNNSGSWCISRRGATTACDGGGGDTEGLMQVDEFRLSGVARTAEWINATYWTSHAPFTQTEELVNPPTPPDTSNPNVTLISPNNGLVTTNTTINFQFRIIDNNDTSIAYNLYVDSAINKTGTAPNNSVIYTTVTGFSEGVHTWFVEGTDNFNNSANSTVWSFDVDLTPPTIAIQSPTGTTKILTGEPINISLSFTAVDTIAGVDSCSYSLDGGSNVSILNCDNTTFLTTYDSHSISVFANDTVGNSDTVISNFVVQEQLLSGSNAALAGLINIFVILLVLSYWIVGLLTILKLKSTDPSTILIIPFLIGGMMLVFLLPTIISIINTLV